MAEEEIKKEQAEETAAQENTEQNEQTEQKAEPKKSYIPSEFMGLYEKYGYAFVRDIVNYGDGVDHLFEKRLETE